MMAYAQGDVVLIRFPLAKIERRPAIIISADWYNNKRENVIVVAISSKLPQQPKRDDYLLSERDQRAGGLPKPSVVKLGNIMTLDKGLIQKRIGRIPEDTVRNLIKRFMDVIS
jgi:mRNA-degrading endonuclease toxin of MazEF toxin-antitoxin module